MDDDVVCELYVEASARQVQGKLLCMCVLSSRDVDPSKTCHPGKVEKVLGKYIIEVYFIL